MSNPSSARLPGSFRDPSGFLFHQDGHLFRQVNQFYQTDYDLLFSSGLYERLTAKKMLIPHTEVAIAPPVPGLAYKIIEPVKLGLISHPYEWAFSQLKDAALLTLRIQKEALQAGLSLKDASAYNIQFYNGRPILIDTLSFSQYREGEPWVAYRQFCMHFLAPLALMANVDVQLGKLSQLYIDGVPLDLASKLLPLSSRLNFGLLTHIHLHAYSQARAAHASSSAPRRAAQMSKLGLTGLIESLESTVKKLVWKPKGTRWVDYYTATNYSDDAFETKKQILRDFFHELAPKTVWDLGANTGVFSRLGADLQDSLIVSTDIDPGAVEVNYRECKRLKTRNVYPLLIDVTNPSPAIGWANTERPSFVQRGPADLIIALALVHHLAISNNLPLADIASWLASLGKHLVIEFVPKEDSQVAILLSSREDIFPNYTEQGFIEAFSAYFRLLKRTPIAGTSRTVFHFESLLAR